MKKIHVKAEVTVFFSDCDPMRHCNNARFFNFLEYARMQYYKKLKALDLRIMNNTSTFGIILAEVSCTFKSPAFIDEKLVIAVRTSEIKTKSFIMEYEIREKKSRRLVALGHSVQVMYNYRRQKTFPIPLPLRRKIERLEGLR
ncbi:MAG: thioesterase family protein [Deltaproteobacteria bacterium]|nr:thioesterase family protein [Deltaproteobacteria bacterium]